MPQTDPGRSENLLAELMDWVRIETPTTDARAVNRLLDVAAAELGGAGAALTRIPGRDGYADNLIARTPGDGRPVVVAGHLDTVWSLGTLDGMPARVDGDKAYGPGIYDMKAGSLIALHVVRAILRQRIPMPRPVVLLLTPDEEVGSPTSRALIEREAAGAARVFIMEPAGPGGACVTARKGVGRFVLRVEGRGAHAGGAFQEGASAVVELARQIGKVHAMVDIERGVTLNAAPIWGGSRPNVIPPDAGCEVDLRVGTEADGLALTERLCALAAETPGCTVTVEGGMNRPPFAEIGGHRRPARACARPGPGARLRAAEAEPGRRVGRQLHRRDGHSDPGRSRLPRWRRPCRLGAHPLAPPRAPGGAAGGAAGSRVAPRRPRARERAYSPDSSRRERSSSSLYRRSACCSVNRPMTWAVSGPSTTTSASPSARSKAPIASLIVICGSSISSAWCSTSPTLWPSASSACASAT